MSANLIKRAPKTKHNTLYFKTQNDYIDYIRHFWGDPHKQFNLVIHIHYSNKHVPLESDGVLELDSWQLQPNFPLSYNYRLAKDEPTIFELSAACPYPFTQYVKQPVD